jgi:hypothetical protein
MVLVEPDLIDADALGQLNFVSWRRNSSSCVEFWRGVVVDQMASRMALPPGASRQYAAIDAMVLASERAVNHTPYPISPHDLPERLSTTRAPASGERVRHQEVVFPDGITKSRV